MITQDINIAILELFDLIKEEDIYQKYQSYESLVMNDKQINGLINKYHFINEELLIVNSIEKEKQLLKDLASIENSLVDIDIYQKYLLYYDMCNKLLNDISDLIFKDIIDIKKDECCGCNKR